MLPSRAIVVLGMHRNGTSVLTRGLQALGVYLGDDFVAPQRDNPTGYWEDRSIQNLNERLLTAFGRTWDSIERIEDASWCSTDLEPFRRQAANYLRMHFLSHPLWGFKDPRTFLLLPFWRSLLQSLDVDYRYVVAIRNPLSVAASLRQRQNTPADDAHLMWLLHMVLPMTQVAERPFVVVDYDRLIADPAAQLFRLAERLQLPIKAKNRTDVAYFERAFVNAELRHHHFMPDDFETIPRLAPTSREAYLRLVQLAADNIALDSEGFWSAWNRLTATAVDLIDNAATKKRMEAELRLERIKAATRFVFQRRSNFPHVQLFVVTGTQRTGTNLLRELLNTNRRIAMVAEVLTPCVPPGHKVPEPPYQAQSEEEAASSYQLVGTGPGPRYPGLNQAGYWGNFLRTVPERSFPSETPGEAEALLDRYFDFLFDLIRNQWVGGDKTNVRAIGVDIKYSHLRRLAPRDWDPTLPPFLLCYLRARGAVLIHAVRRNLVQCTVSALSVNHTSICHNYAGKVMDHSFAIDMEEFLVYARRIVQERERFLRQAEGMSMVEYEYEDLVREIKRADAGTGEIPHEPGPLKVIAAALGVPFRFVYSGRLKKTINVPYGRLLSNRDKLVRALEKTEFREFASTLA
jgi:hypothetical protein